jgi:hypothetical protein
MILTPSLTKTQSKTRANLGVAIAKQEASSEIALFELPGQVASQLRHPLCESSRCQLSSVSGLGRREGAT